MSEVEAENMNSRRAPLTTEGLPPAERLRREGIPALFFLLVGLVILCLVPLARLECERSSAGDAVCRLEWRVLFSRIVIREANLHHLSGAHVGERSSQSRRGTIRSYQLVFESEAGPRPLDLDSERQAIESLVGEIRAFLDGETRRLALRLGSASEVARWIGHGLFLLGVVYTLALPWYLYLWVRSGASGKRLAAPTRPAPETDPR